MCINQPHLLLQQCVHLALPVADKQHRQVLHPCIMPRRKQPTPYQAVKLPGQPVNNDLWFIYV